MKREERIRLGAVDVDSGQLLLIDPCYLSDWDPETSYEEVCRLTLGESRGGQLDHAPQAPGKGVAFSSGFGDGTYEVWATVQDFGEWGRRITRVEIDLLGSNEDETTEPEGDPWS